MYTYLIKCYRSYKIYLLIEQKNSKMCSLLYIFKIGLKVTIRIKLDNLRLHL